MTSPETPSTPAGRRSVGRFRAAAVLLLCLAAGLAAWAVRTRAPESQTSSNPVEMEVEPSGPAGPAWFQDVTDGSGLDATYRNGEEAGRYTILESVGGGVALIDYDGDGRLDVVVAGGGRFSGPDGTDIHGLPTRLFRNLGDWTFQDVTAGSGLDRPRFYTHGCAVADFDRDGWPDLLVTGYGRLALYRNESDGRGGRRFVEVTEAAGLDSTLWSTSAGWADLTGNGYPDLYVCHYLDWSFENHPVCGRDGRQDVCPPQRFRPLPHALYFNNGDGTFRDVTVEQGLREDGCGLGVVLADLNGTGRPDIYVANDATDNFLYLNRGGRLEEAAGIAGVAVDEHGLYNGSMGVDAGDYDGSGRPALWVTNFQGETHALYANLGDELFHYQSQAAGIAALGRRFVGFGTGFFDADNDGWEDLVIANGHVQRYPSGAGFRQRAVLLRNVERQGRRFFRDDSGQAGPYFEREFLGRGVAIGDLDNDGWPDLVISHSNSPVVVLRNDGAAVHGHRWLGVELAGRDHRDVAGSTVTLEAGGRRLTRFVKGGGSYLSAGDGRLLFGLGVAGAPGRLTVRWSWGETQHWEGLEPNAYWRLHEGDPRPERVAGPEDP